MEKKDIEKINFKALPNISNAWWNSRGILALLAYILLPEHWQQLQPACDFITSAWMNIWFSNHYYERTNYEVLLAAVAKAKKSFLRNLCNQKTVINTARSNICAESTVNTVQEIMVYAKTEKTINKKLILCNKIKKIILVIIF